jgi:4-hydroxy-tetrahydrodipicolinate synthase
MFFGSIPALITPFRNGALDERGFQAFVERQVAAGSQALVATGTTGEAPVLSDAEHRRVVALCVEAAGQAPVIAGCGAASTEHALCLMRQAKSAGASAALVATPYYNRPGQEGLFAHYKALAEGGDLPLLLYNVPARTAVDLLPETVARLAKFTNVIGVKDASRDLGRVARHRNDCGDDFLLLSGEDDTAVGFNAMGGTGCISVTANAAPALCAQMQEACARGDYGRARAINLRLADLHKAMFVEASPAPAKYAASLLYDTSPDTRLPILPLSEAGQKVVRAAMVKAGLLNS